MFLVVIAEQASSNINVMIIVEANPGFRKANPGSRWQEGCGVKISHSTDRNSVCELCHFYL